jgi:hypothetical protein
VSGAPQEAAGGVTTLIGQNVARSPARRIVDGHVRKLPARAADRITSVAADPVARAYDAAELLDV